MEKERRLEVQEEGRRYIHSQTPFMVKFDGIQMSDMVGNPSLALPIEEKLFIIVKELFKGSLDVSVSKTGEFSGREDAHIVSSMSLEEFVMNKQSFHLYLAQLPLFEATTDKNTIIIEPKSKDTTSNERRDAILAKENALNWKRLKSNFKLVDLLSGFVQKIESVNLWWSRKETVSSFHFDAYNNFLFVLKGTKKVTLLPHSSKGLKTDSIFSPNFNQAKQVDEEAERRATQVELTPGEMLFIPCGWFHKVISIGDEIIAVNFWFDSITAQISTLNADKLLLSKYLIREVIEEKKACLIQRYFKRARKSLGISARKQGKAQNWPYFIKNVIASFVTFERNQDAEIRRRGNDYLMFILMTVDYEKLRTVIDLLFRELSNSFQPKFLHILVIEKLTSILQDIDSKAIFKFTGEAFKQIDGSKARDEFYEEHGSFFSGESISYLLKKKRHLNSWVMQRLRIPMLGAESPPNHSF